MNSIDKLGSGLCPDGVEFKTLGEVGEFIRGTGLQKKDLMDFGVPAIHYGQIHTSYGISVSKTKSFASHEVAAKLRHAKTGDLLIATTSEDDEAVAKATAWLGDTEAVVSGDAFIYRHRLEPRYVSYFFQSEHFQSQKHRYISGAKVRRISGASLAKILIPIPPFKIQQKIADILDTFSELEAELGAELEARTQQYEYFRHELLTSVETAEWSTLGGISSKVSSGGTPSSGNTAYYGGDISWLRTQEVDFNIITSTDLSITEEGLKNSSAKWIPANCVIVAMYGATAAKVAINAIPLTTNQACCNLEIDEKQADYRYVFHWISNQYEKLKALGQGSQSNLNAKTVKAYPIPVPALSAQRQIAEVLDKFDALVSDISIGLPAEITARRQQYEYYRDQLLSFKELEAAP